MKIMRDILAILGGIFVFLILLIIVFILVKPYGIDIVKLSSALFDKNQSSSYDHPYLTNQQEIFLESIGVDPKEIPTKITPELQKCATSMLGETRAHEIVSGSTPTMSELLKLKSCLK